ncbi:hypothetical protein H5410_051367 [Solanum commersonii]|uniref:Uncharacterized protein n=1 Tax=Solanum commersonii TaxID=4109 RepID=A0A9J5X0B9_SOLCO|nr:hypothetical protein H5410_051367 [Solanum commersonii]
MVDEISSGFVLCDGKHGPISGESSKQVKASVATVGGRRKRSLLSPSCDHLLSQVKTACHPYGSVFFVEWIHLLRKYPCSEISYHPCIGMDITWSLPTNQFTTAMYIDIAKYGFFALENYGDRDTKLSDQKEPQTLQNTVLREKPTDLEGVMISIAEQLYSVLLLTFFFMEVYVTGFIPYIGKALNFMLLSWLYAYYCFEYKWNLSGLSLDKRLDFFESNWAFFAGFGNPCVLAIFLFSPLVSCGVMAMLFPLVEEVAHLQGCTS